MPSVGNTPIGSPHASEASEWSSVKEETTQRQNEALRGTILRLGRELRHQREVVREAEMKLELLREQEERLFSLVEDVTEHRQNLARTWKNHVNLLTTRAAEAEESNHTLIQATSYLFELLLSSCPSPPEFCNWWHETVVPLLAQNCTKKTREDSAHKCLICNHLEINWSLGEGVHRLKLHDLFPSVQQILESSPKRSKNDFL